VIRLKSLVSRNIELAKIRQQEAIDSNPNAYHFWDGYLSALESIVHVLPNDEEEHEEILQARQSPTSSDNPTSS
jgi:hypothetical protein